MTPGTWDGSKSGMRGKEDFGDGFAALFNLMSHFNPANCSAQFANPMLGQQAHAGLTHPAYGSLTLGRRLTSYYWNGQRSQRGHSNAGFDQVRAFPQTSLMDPQLAGEHRFASIITSPKALEFSYVVC
jgi:predicted porin